MLVATHETVGWLREKIGRFHLRQLNGAIMVLSGLAVVAIPMVMANMHGGHGGGHGQMDHGSHSAMMSDADSTAHHDMSQMDSTVDHSMHDMSALYTYGIKRHRWHDGKGAPASLKSRSGAQ